MPKVSVDKNKCIGCQACLGVCPQNVFEIKNGVSVPVNDNQCIGCQACEHTCPVDAIKVEFEEEN